MFAGKTGRTGGDDPLFEQQQMLGIGPGSGAKVDGGVKGFAGKVERSQACAKVQRHPRIFSEEMAEPRCQPAGAEGGKDRQVEHPAAGVGPQPERGPCDQFKRLPHIAGIGKGRLGRAQPPPLASEKLHPQLALETLHQPADRPLCQAEFTRRRRGGAEPAHCLESREKRDGGKVTPRKAHMCSIHDERPQ